MQMRGLLFIRESAVMSRITESELRRPILEALANSPTGFMTTTNLIAAMESRFHPTGEDAEILAGRNDTKFSQKVRNAVGSHRDSGPSLASMGYVEYESAKHGSTIKADGRAFLDAAHT
jgi:hypothetical protein